MEKSIDETCLIHEMPYEIMRDLCSILDSGEIWIEIVPYMPGIGNNDVEGCKRYGNAEKAGYGATWLLLRVWASKGYSILDLYIVFAHAKMVRCMEIMKALINPKHYYLQQLCLGGGVASAPRISANNTSQSSSKGQQNWSMIGSRNSGTEPLSSSVRPPHATASSSAETASSSTTDDSSARIFTGLQNTPQVSYSELELATDNFSRNNMVGKGGYGVVYRGEWKQTKVAVKRLHAGAADRGNQFEKERLRQSLQELRTLAKYRHDNILPLYAFSLDGPEPCLVYQFMANGSLEDRILCREGTAPLNWRQKLDIAEGAARGLHFLHTIGRTPIIHGDVKTANILLDKHLEPKLGDFGLSRDGQVEADVEEKFPLIASHIKGTLAYLPPEFITSKILSTKLDVYSFGVVLLELAAGLRAYVDTREPHGLAEYCAMLSEKNDRKPNALFVALVDKRTPSINPEVDKAFFSRLLRLGLQCSRKERSDRPAFKEIVEELAKNIDSNK
ncbi:unnamed protein product, partial [Mesorhabditis belari]|uniref:non-specific serine/threonine protein kinase n=1 Tax=Mesorhabditis belari TaxID=2138241 RepID=A0AAF3JAI0_9BILA